MSIPSVQHVGRNVPPTEAMIAHIQEHIVEFKATYDEDDLETYFLIRFTFLNFPSYPSTLATYSIFLDGARRVNREQFVFRGDAGGFYQKQIHYCAPLRKVGSHKIRVTGSWKAYVACPGCREIISFRHQP